VLNSHIESLISRYTLKGVSILVHCRGGVGRAGLIACCWMLKMGLCGWIRKMEFPPAEHPFQTFLHQNAPELVSDAATNGHPPDPIVPCVNGVAPHALSHKNGESAKHTVSEAMQGKVDPAALSLIPLDTMDLVERAIRVVRRRRSVKAIETFEQVHFLVQFVEFLRNSPRPPTAP